jgi:UDP-N-acetylglucosamine--N-acetylmuramyl-(pentapeptide) pyrophosphoryl-undecaprenol N-acetylglucosamine transferase
MVATGDEHMPSSTGPSKRSMERKVERLERETRRLRNSISFQLGVHLTSAVRKPWRLLALPLTFPYLVIRLGMQRIGHRPRGTPSPLKIHPPVERQHCIVLFPTNGVGFGHFTRMYAVARALRKADPDLEIVFFTPMPTLHILYNEGFPTYHLAGRYMHNDMSASQWNGLVEDMLHIVFENHRPKWFMFDGAFPYRGMLNAIASQQGMEKWWMKRGSLKSNKQVPVDSLSHFSGIIHPSEGLPEEPSETVHHVPPLRLIDPDESWSRTYARSRLSVSDSDRVVYVQLGAGRINNIEDVLQEVLDALFSHPEVCVVLGESMLGRRLDVSHERLRIIRDFPNALYVKAFDASVQAGGYNSYQEMRTFGIPTLFIPNRQTGMDDQMKRCMNAEHEGWGLVYDTNKHDLEAKVQALFELRAEPQYEPNGVNAVVDLLNIRS